MLIEVESAESGPERFDLPQYGGRDFERRRQTLDDLYAEQLVRSDGRPQIDGAGGYVAVRGLRLTEKGRRELEQSRGAAVGITIEEQRQLEVVIRIVERAKELGELEELGEVGRELAAQAETIRVQVYEAPEPDRSIVRRALSRLWTATQAISTIAGLTALADLPHAIKAIGTLLS